MDLKDLDFTQNGNEIRHFKLVDTSGLFLQCAAIGPNAKSGALRENFEVVVYFGTGRGPLGSSGGTFYMMKDSVIVPIGHKVLAGKPSFEIPIQDAV